MILDSLSIATDGYVGIGPGSGDYCPTALSIGSGGYIRIRPDDAQKSGTANARRLRLDREKLAKQRALQQIEENRKELDEIVDRLKSTGSVVVGGTEIEAKAPVKPKSPILQAAPALRDIKSSVEREIAELIRFKEIAEFNKSMSQFQQDLEDFENAIVVIIMLAME